jgi:uncharacterized protein (DUF488 family)
MIYTSCYKKNQNNPLAVSIAGRPIEGYQGKEYRALAPKLWFFKKYKEDGDQEFYVEHFYKEVLDVLDPIKVAEELDGMVLLCYEETGFCHRHVVAQWLRHAGIEVEEI